MDVGHPVKNCDKTLTQFKKKKTLSLVLFNYLISSRLHRQLCVGCHCHLAEEEEARKCYFFPPCSVVASTNGLSKWCFVMETFWSESASQWNTGSGGRKVAPSNDISGSKHANNSNGQFKQDLDILILLPAHRSSQQSALQRVCYSLYTSSIGYFEMH